MTLTIDCDTEVRLRLVAEWLEMDPQRLHDALLRQALAEAEQEQLETLAGLDESVEAFGVGRWVTADELDRRLTARRSQ